MFLASSVVCVPNTRLGNLVVLCSTDESSSATLISKVAVSSDGKLQVQFVGSCDAETAVLARAQAYLACRSTGCLPSWMLEQAWLAFYAQCEHLARRILAIAYGKWCAADGDDFVQEALRQVITKLPGLVIRRNHRRAYSWVVRVVWREIGRAVSRHERYSLRHQPLHEDMAASLPCPHPVSRFR